MLSHLNTVHQHLFKVDPKKRTEFILWLRSQDIDDEWTISGSEAESCEHFLMVQAQEDVRKEVEWQYTSFVSSK